MEITGYEATIDETIRLRLMDLGFTTGNLVECLRRVPLSGPRVFEIAGSVFALEKEVASLVVVKKKEPV